MMRATIAGALLLIVGMMAGACLLDIDEPKGTGGASSASGSGATSSSASDGGSGGSGSGGCGPGMTCVEGTWVLATDMCPPGSKEVWLSTCESCACNAVGPGVCSLAGKVTACGQGGAGDFGSNSNTCIDVGSFSGANVSTTLNNGHCDIIAPSVASTARKVCELVGSGSCGVGGSCVPVGLAATACQELEGVSSCPAGLPFWAHVSTKLVGACTCACEPCGDMFVTVYPEKSCQGTGAVIGADGQCKESGFDHIYSVKTPPNKPIDCAKRGRPDMSTERLCCPGPL